MRLNSKYRVFKTPSKYGILDRNKIRDLYNVVYLLKFHNYTSENILNTIKNGRLTEPAINSDH